MNCYGDKIKTKTLVLAQAIHEKREVLFGNVSTDGARPQSTKEKEDAWESVRQEMIVQGYSNFEHKSWREVRNHDWQYLRRTAVAKFEHNQRSGYDHLKYTDVDKLVFEVITTGNNANNSNGDDQDQNDSFEVNYVPSLGFNNEAVKTESADSNSKFMQLRSHTAKNQTNNMSNGVVKRSRMNSKVHSGSYDDNLYQPEHTQSNVTNGTTGHDDLDEEERNSEDGSNAYEVSSNNGTGLNTSRRSIALYNSKDPILRVPEGNNRKRFASYEEDNMNNKMELMLRVRREEIGIELERIKLEQEKAKLEQEKVKFEQEKAKMEQEKAKFEQGMAKMEQEKAKFEWERTKFECEKAKKECQQ